MMRAIISDSSCLISLFNAGELELLMKVFGEITITPVIAEEFGLPLPDWIVVVPNKVPIPSSFQGIDLDLGEASAISLARELGGAMLIVDDLKARRVAELFSIDFMGTLGVAVEAKKRGLISSIRPLIEKLRDAGLHFSLDVEQRALANANEL
jgi:predicted nucleic acid-binding protein